ncbi:MAG TPA: helix-turn-helix transcriptional regulator [Micromonosporaceae bacterium]
MTSDDRERAAIAREVRAELARRRMTQHQVGELLGLSQQSVSRRLSGEVPWRADELLYLAEALDVPVTCFYPEKVMTK